MENAFDPLASPKKNYSRKRTESFVDDIFNAGANIFPTAEMEVDSDDSKGEEMSNLKIKMALESLDGLRQLPKKALSKFDKTKIISMLNYVKDKKEKIRKYTNTSNYRRKADKFYHCSSLSVVSLVFYVLGYSPGLLYFYLLLGLEGYLITRRFIYYRTLGWHYFMVDFCYFCNASLLALIYLYPNSRYLYLFCYMVCAGILAFALVSLRNSCVFHLVDKMTDLLIHLLPLITMYNIHWNIRGTENAKYWGFVDPLEFHFGFEFVLECLIAFNIFYFSWAVFYYFIIAGVCRHRIKRKGYWTLLQMQTDKSKVACGLREKYGQWACTLYFATSHYLYTLIMALIAMPGFFIQAYSLGSVILYIVATYKNGADYYIEYFAKKYVLDLQELDKLEQNIKDHSHQDNSNGDKKAETGKN